MPLAVPTAALCPLGDKATAVGEEIARDKLEREGKSRKKEEVREGKPMGINSCNSMPKPLSMAILVCPFFFS